jgi:hypothetical protein
LREANDWYRRGGGRDLTVDASQIDLAWGRGLATNFGLSSGTGYTINYYGKALINQYKPFIPYR